MSQSDWTLYVKTHCPWCHEAIAYLREHGYDFREVDVNRDSAAYGEMRERSGQSKTPTLFIESTGQMLPDFDVDQLEAFLKKNDLLKKAA